MPLFVVHMFEGRTAEQKREFVEAITRTTCDTLKCTPDAVDIIIQDVRREDWSTAGTLWSDRK